MFEKDFPKIMGILNVTPDSFSDGGLYYSPENAVRKGLQLIEDGADILDVGGESTRPGAPEISTEEEIKRVIPVIKEINRLKPGIPISVDTTKYEVAKAAIDSGAIIINDISGLEKDLRLAELAADNDLSLILMHIQGTPRTMQNNPFYDNVVEDIYHVLLSKINLAKSLGVKSIIADVGIGFGKSVEHNLKLLKYHNRFEELGVPLLIGLSRKRFIGKILEINEPADRDLPTLLFHALLLNNNINILRVHNVANIFILKKIFLAFKNI